MKTSARGIKFISDNEGLVTHIYNDQAGIPTIGVGHRLTRVELMNHAIVIAGVSCPLAGGLADVQCYALLAQDVAPAENEVNSAVQVELNQNQFDALVDFTFNCGVGAFASSHALIDINAGNFDNVPADLAMWNKITVNGVHEVCADLTARRAKEGALFSEAV